MGNKNKQTNKEKTGLIVGQLIACLYVDENYPVEMGTDGAVGEKGE